MLMRSPVWLTLCIDSKGLWTRSIPGSQGVVAKTASILIWLTRPASQHGPARDPGWALQTRPRNERPNERHALLAYTLWFAQAAV